jgi:hypothetical protein
MAGEACGPIHLLCRGAREIQRLLHTAGNLFCRF